MHSTNSSNLPSTSQPFNTTATTTATTTSTTPTPTDGQPRITMRTASTTIPLLQWPNTSGPPHTAPPSPHARNGQRASHSSRSAQNIQDDTELTLAAAAGNVVAVTSLLEAGSDPGQVNCKGHCALVRAARNGHAKIILLLTSFLNEKTRLLPETLQLALAWAASRGHTAAVEALLDAGAEIDRVTPAGHTALMLAASNGHADTVRELLKKDASPHLKNNEGDTVPALAARNRHDKVCMYLYWYKDYIDKYDTGDVQARNVPLIRGRENGLTQQQKDDALMKAVTNGDKGIASELIAKHLLAAGANVNAEDEAGKPALMVAIDMGHTHVVQVLLDHGANIDHALQTGWRPLNSAAKAGNMGLASLLLRNRIPVDTADASGNTCLTLAAHAGNDKFVTFLLGENADIEHANEAGNTALILAASNGHKSTVLELIAHGANILCMNSAGMNAERCAAKNSHKDIENLLKGAAAFLKAAAQEDVAGLEKTIRQDWLNCVDGSGRTALIIAVKNGCVENAALLIKERAGLDAQDSDGNTALLIAANHRAHRDELLKVLLSDPLRQPNLRLKNKANTAIRDLLDQADYHYPVPRTLLLGALTKSGKALLEVCRQGKIPNARTLLMRGADTTVKSRDGNCALHVAAIDGNHDIVQSLLDHGAMIDVVNDENLTALHLAARCGHIGLVYRLLQNGASPDGIAAALLSEEAGAAQEHLSSSSSTSQAAPSLNRDVILDLLKFHRYLSGADADMPVLDIPVDALLKSANDVYAFSAGPHESLAPYGLCRHIITGLRERSAGRGLFEKAMVADDGLELVSAGQKQTCWAAVLSSLWDHALGPKAKEILANDHIPVLTVQRYSRLLKQQVMWLLNTTARAEKAMFDKMLAFDAPLADKFARYGSYHPIAHYHHLRNCGMASVLADFVTSRYLRVVGASSPSGISKSGFAKAVNAALDAQEFIRMLEKWFKEAQDDPSFRAILNRQIDQLKQACQQLLNGDRSE